MSKKPAKAEKPTKPDKGATASGDVSAPAKKRSRVKLALLVLIPLLVLGGSGYGAWMFFLAKPAAGGAHAAGGEVGHGEANDDGHGKDGGADGADTMHVAAVPAEVLAETSATHNYALAVLIAPPCGMDIEVPALKAASEAEAHTDGNLVNLSWVAAARRTAGITPKNCDYLASEVANAEDRLGASAQPAKSGGHH